MEIETTRPGEEGEVFPAAQLVWLDEESGEELAIEVVGEAPWVTHLAETGFVPASAGDPLVRRHRCRIVFPSRNG